MTRARSQWLSPYPRRRNCLRGSSIVVTPLYTLDEAEANTRATTRAAESVMLIGTNVACTDANATLSSPIELAYDVDAEVAQSITAQNM